MKTSSLIASAAVVLSVSLLLATVSAKDEKTTKIKTPTLAECTNTCQMRMDTCRSNIGKTKGTSEQSCKATLTVCLQSLCGLSASSAAASAAGSSKKK